MLEIFLGLNCYKIMKIKCLAQGHNTVAVVWLEPGNPLSQVEHTTTKPIESYVTVLIYFLFFLLGMGAFYAFFSFFCKYVSCCFIILQLE